MPRCCRRCLAVPQELILQISSLSVRFFPLSQPSTVALLNEITQGSPAQGKGKENLLFPEKRAVAYCLVSLE